MRVNSLKDIYKKRFPTTISEIAHATFCNLVYAIWIVRNKAVWKYKVPVVCRIIDFIKQDTKERILNLPRKGNIPRWFCIYCKKY